MYTNIKWDEGQTDKSVAHTSMLRNHGWEWALWGLLGLLQLWAIVPTGVYEGHVCGGQGKVGLQHLLV